MWRRKEHGYTELGVEDSAAAIYSPRKTSIWRVVILTELANVLLCVLVYGAWRTSQQHNYYSGTFSNLSS